ncbi:MAG: DUF3784 domain-containing protein [Eubacterium sp.]|nr:DUF3784 domain-containing protein [Eubacterium sp.]
MFGGTLDVFLAIIFSLLAVVFFMGKGKGILELFGGKHEMQRKRSKEEQREYERLIGIFMVPLAIVEIISLFVHHEIMGLIVAAVAVVDLIFFAKKTRDFR